MNSSVVQFFNGKSILVTGFSGFLGKVLVGKLVNDTNVKTVYVLIRDKNGVNYKDRIQKILSNLPFSSDKNANIDHCKRIIPIEGDLTFPGLGIKEDELKILQQQVSVVFHSAADVRFNVGLSTNFAQNVEGTANLIEIIKTFDNLKCYVHVSSLYSAGNQSIVEENLEPLEFGYKEIRKYISCSSNDKDDVNIKKLEARFPNSYTMTKALAEDLVLKEIGSSVPTAIVRPSIVFISEKEPKRGWGDTIQGIQGICVAASVGLLQTVNWDYWTRFETVPVDMCANFTIASAWYMAEQSSTRFNAFNLSSGPFNLDWSYGRVFEVLRGHAIELPSSKVMRPLIKPPKYKKAPFYFPVQKFIYHSLFALIIDLVISFLGHKKFLYKVTTKLNDGLDQVAFFTTHQYEIKTSNYQKLIDTMLPEDRKTFFCDFRNFDMNAYLAGAYFGFRKYFLKEDESNLVQARNRARLVFTAYRTIQLILFLIIGYAFLSFFRFILGTSLTY